LATSPNRAMSGGEGSFCKILPTKLPDTLSIAERLQGGRSQFRAKLGDRPNSARASARWLTGRGGLGHERMPLHIPRRHRRGTSFSVGTFGQGSPGAGSSLAKGRPYCARFFFRSSNCGRNPGACIGQWSCGWGPGPENHPPANDHSFRPLIFFVGNDLPTSARRPFCLKHSSCHKLEPRGG